MPMVPVEELIGKTVGSARPVRLLGHGKLSAVYEAYQPEQNRSVMLTLFLVPPSLPPNAHEHFLQRFKQEASALVQLNHPSILPTYDFGDYDGYPYLLTPFVNKIPLARFLKQRGHFSPQESLSLLQQIAPCIDYAHNQQMIHGTLSASNILIDQDLSIQVAGFGFMRMLEARGILSLQEPYAHLLSIAGTFLGSPEYLAPEYVQGEAADGRVDVYALGILLYELLSGTRPFEGSNPYEIALQHVQKRVPSLHEQFSFVPAALDVVIAQALEQNPAQRFQTAGALVGVFGRVLKILEATVSVPQNALPAAQQITTLSPSPATDLKQTMPPTVNWFDEGMLQTNGLQATSLTKTGPMPTLNNAPFPANQNPGFYNDSTTQIPGQPADQVTAIDPFAWWSAASQPVEEHGQLLGEGSLTATKHSKTARQQGIRSGKRGGQTVPQEGRRRTIIVLAGGGVVALGALGFGGISLAHFLTKKTVSTSGGTQTTLVSTPAPTKVPSPTIQATPTHAPTPTPTSAPKPTATPVPVVNTPPTATPIQQPTPAPTPTAAPPAHTGTVIGKTNQATNTGLTFTNPADQQTSLLIHLPNGNFTAFENTCSHEGAATRYDAAAQVIRCTRHTNGTYNPATGTPTGGPPPRPLQQVQIRVNGDGTITTG